MFNFNVNRDKELQKGIKEYLELVGMIEDDEYLIVDTEYYELKAELKGRQDMRKELIEEFIGKLKNEIYKQNPNWEFNIKNTKVELIIDRIAKEILKEKEE